MKKFIIYALGLAILATLVADTAFVILGTASIFTVVEAAVGWTAVLAIAVAAFVRTVSRPWPRATPDDISRLQSRIDELESENDSLREERDELESRIDDLNEKLSEADRDSQADPEADPVERFADEHLEVLEPVISALGEDGKLHEIYRLPPEPSVDQAYAAASESIRARESEGNPVVNPYISFIPQYR